MKIWIIPTVALSLLLASPAAFAAPPDQNASSQQDQHKDKNANGGGQSGHDNANKSGGTNAGSHTNNTNQNTNINHNVNIDRNVSINKNKNTTINRNVTIDRNINKNTNVNRHIIVKHTVDVHRVVPVNRHFDVRVYQRNFNSPHRYHWQTYRQPPGWYHHRWGYGQHLPRAWFVHDYWIPNFIMFGLIAPPHGYVWVRVGEDALLVDTETGEVIRVEYGVFY